MGKKHDSVVEESIIREKGVLAGRIRKDRGPGYPLAVALLGPWPVARLDEPTAVGLCVGLHSEGRINSTRRIFVEFSSDRTYIYIIRSSLNFFTDIRRIFDESHVILDFCMIVI